MFTSVIILCLIYTLGGVSVCVWVAGGVAGATESVEPSELMIIKLFAFNWNAWLRVI